MANEFCDLPIWASTDKLPLPDPDETIYSPSDYLHTKNSMSSPSGSVVDGDDLPGYLNHFFPSSTSGSEECRMGISPQYQLPSPTEDEPGLPSAINDKERRRKQNRAAQRAFRERKETKLKQLEKQIVKLTEDRRAMERRYHSLRTAHLRLQSGLKILLDASGTFDEFDTLSGGLLDPTKE